MPRLNNYPRVSLIFGDDWGINYWDALNEKVPAWGIGFLINECVFFLLLDMNNGVQTKVIWTKNHGWMEYKLHKAEVVASGPRHIWPLYVFSKFQQGCFWHMAPLFVTCVPCMTHSSTFLSGMLACQLKDCLDGALTQLFDCAWNLYLDWNVGGKNITD